MAGDADPVALALRAWERMAGHLGPLIGEVGYRTLYGRAVRLVAAQYPCLTPSHPSQAFDSVLAILKENLASMDGVDASATNITLLDTFISLLSDLIGEALTARFLTTAWAAGPEETNNA